MVVVRWTVGLIVMRLAFYILDFSTEAGFAIDAVLDDPFVAIGLLDPIEASCVLTFASLFLAIVIFPVLHLPRELVVSLRMVS